MSVAHTKSNMMLAFHLLSSLLIWLLVWGSQTRSQTRSRRTSTLQTTPRASSHLLSSLLVWLFVWGSQTRSQTRSRRMSMLQNPYQTSSEWLAFGDTCDGYVLRSFWLRVLQQRYVHVSPSLGWLPRVSHVLLKQTCCTGGADQCASLLCYDTSKLRCQFAVCIMRSSRFHCKRCCWDMSARQRERQETSVWVHTRATWLTQLTRIWLYGVCITQQTWVLKPPVTNSCSDAQVARYSYLGEINHPASSSNNKPLALTKHHATQLSKHTIKPAAVQPCKQASKQPTTTVRDARKLSFPSLWFRCRFGNIMGKVFADEPEKQHVPSCGERSAWT